MIVDKPRAKVPREPRRQSECFVLDVSPGGAKIMTDAEINVRDTFGLALVADRPNRQPCEVVWRRGNIYGVRFLP